MRLIKEIDHEGVRLRKSYTLNKRKYCAKGPNFIWDTDVYDKLKQFGLCCHAALGRYSRRFIW